eukprot:ctg_29.g8
MEEDSTSSLFSRRRTSRLDVSWRLASGGEDDDASDSLSRRSSGRPSVAEAEFDVVLRFRGELARGTPMAPAAVHVLTHLIRCSRAETVLGLELELREASQKMLFSTPVNSLALRAACELFLRHVARTSLDVPQFGECKKRLIERGEQFRLMVDTCRERIGAHGERFIMNGHVVMTHGGSRVVYAILRAAVQRAHKTFRVVVTEGRSLPESSSGSNHGAVASMSRKTMQFCRDVLALGVPVTVVPDSAVAAMMETADFVLLGAEAVVESGAVINQVGSLNMALAAKALNVKLFVAAETYKFARMYPLSQQDLSDGSRPTPYRQLFRDEAAPRGLMFETPASDIIPPHLVSLLFTDSGVLTPAAVSEELIKLYQ